MFGILSSIWSSTQAAKLLILWVSIYTTCLWNKVGAGLRPKQEPEFLTCFRHVQVRKRDGEEVGLEYHMLASLHNKTIKPQSPMAVEEAHIQVKEWSKFCREDLPLLSGTNPGSSEMHKKGANSCFGKLKVCFLNGVKKYELYRWFGLCILWWCV